MAIRTARQLDADARRRKHPTRQAAKRAKARAATARRQEIPRLSDDEKAARRREHAERLEACREWLGTVDGMREWLIARELNPDVSPLNAALCAQQAPRSIVQTSSGWRRNACRIRPGEHAAAYITAPGFWPKPAFTAAQTDAPPELTEPLIRIPAAAEVESLTAIYRDAYAASSKHAIAVILERLEEIGEIPAESVDRGDSRTRQSDDIPF